MLTKYFILNEKLKKGNIKYTCWVNKDTAKSLNIMATVFIHNIKEFESIISFIFKGGDWPKWILTKIAAEKISKNISVKKAYVEDFL